MIITQLSKHFPARFPEWMNAAIMATWGAYITLHPDMFNREPMATVLAGLAKIQWIDYPPAIFWGSIALFVGAIRGCALFINGAYSRTPLIRLVTSAVSAFVWSQVVIGLLATGLPNLGLAVYPWLVIIDIASAYRAGIDVGLAEKQRRAARRDRERNRIDTISRFGRPGGTDS